MASRADSTVFGRRTAPHVLILARGEKIRHLTIRPWMAVLAFCVVGFGLIGYLGATTYLVLRDDLIGATMARQARMQHDYEDRIAGLRAQLDRITSRQLLDQQVVEQKVEKLLQQQTTLFSRHGRLGSLIDRAEESGVMPDAAAMDPATAGRQASATAPNADEQPDIASQGVQLSSAATPLRENLADRADRVFSKVTRSLKDIERQQLTRIADLTAGASKTADAITSILQRTGVDVAAAEPDAIANGDEKAGIGGPLLPPRPSANAFDSSLDDLDSALDRLDSARETARVMPFANPAPGHNVTSRFGNRVDPFLGTLALHSGIDFGGAIGDEIKSTGAGKVTIAGPVSGYGNMVEIDHGQGITTRYGHMSRILVRVGDTIATGEVIGRIGMTGRSTGPHVHYEVRRNGDPIDPVHFLNAGMKLTTYLN